ncbi:AAA family ATPase [Schleiferilactobacillus shenzhenensis]|uniref:AAA family ATPase n=1 Tax=Schleiferilactobacillus shenzhenensis TaxID=1231337 RepID=UPI0003F9A2AB|nr:AAA family ATPase [Schleiferilactobacillus shenzhenensis]
MAEGKIILVEGISNSGKTTLCKYMRERDGYTVVPEAIRYLERRLDAPGDDILNVPQSREQEIRNQDILFDLEFEKLFDANYRIKHGQNVVIDKSAYSIVATAYAFRKRGLVPDAYELAEKRFLKFWDKVHEYHLRLPDCNLLLRADAEKSQQRNLSRSHMLRSVWTEESTRSGQETSLEEQFSRLGNSAVLLETTGLSPEEVYKMATAAIRD